jgi:hypothetical protein
MKRLLLLACLAPVLAVAGVITNCPAPQCNFQVTETSLWNIATIQFDAELASLAPQATATFTLNDDFSTGGPVRPGIVVLTFWTNGDYSDGGLSTGTATFGPYSCAGSLKIPSACFASSERPITLGQAVPVQMNISLAGTSDGIVPGGGNRTFLLEAQFYEDTGGVRGDGVAASAGPEPATLWLFAGAALAVGLHRLRARRLKSRGE